MSYQAAIDAGVDILDTAMSPFALGTSQPPTESVVASLVGTERDTGIDLMTLRAARNACLGLRDRYGSLVDPISERVDSDVLLYQLPGGMISNLVSQLKEQDALDRLDELYREVPRVRADLGYPPLVTPTSQIVGTQAVLNVLLGERYKNVSKEVRDYVRGLYGHSPAPIADDIRQQILGEEAECVECRPADLLEPIYDKMFAQADEQGLARCEEDVLSYILYPAIAPSFLKGERSPEPIPTMRPGNGNTQRTADVPSVMEVEVDGERFSVRILSVEGTAVAAGVERQDGRVPKGDVVNGIKSNMQGMVLEVRTSRGAAVKKGDTLVVLEAMKMENPIHSPRDGTVTEIYVDAGDVVHAGDVLLVVE